jgi:hypothetical protein
VQPSVTAENGDQEGIPVSLMEAQAGGLPVVATRHSGIPELVSDGHTGLLVDERDVLALAEAIQRLLDTPRLALDLATAGRARVEQEFDRDRQARRFARYLEEVIADPDARPSVCLARRAAGTRTALFIRSVPVGVTVRKLIVLAHRDPGTRFSVLTNRSAAPALHDCPLVEQIETYEDGRLGLRQIGANVLRRLQESRHDVVFAPYTDDSGTGAGSVHRVARAAGGRRHVALTARDDEIRLRSRPCRPRLSHAEPAASAPVSS